MSEPSQRPPIAASPISAILFAQALATDTLEVLHAWQKQLDTLQRPYEIIILHETRPEVVPSEVPTPIRAITYDRAAGFRQAFNDAIRSARYPLVVFCTCDMQYRPADLDGMLKVIDKVDLVIGFRAGGQAPPWRVMLDLMLGVLGRVFIGIPMQQRTSWLGSSGWSRRWIARWIFGLRVQDPECPFRLARRTIFERMPMQSNGPFVQVEMLAKANHLTCLLTEEPVTWTPPSAPLSDAPGFGADAWGVFRDPDFGAFEKPTEPAAT